MSTLPAHPIELNETHLSELKRHVEEHKYLANESIPFEISMKDAYESWTLLVFAPLTDAIAEFSLVKRFPRTSSGDLFLAVSQHWYHMKKGGSADVSAREAVLDYAYRFAPKLRSRVGAFFQSFVV